VPGLGTGFFIDAGGTLLTAYHVIQGCAGGVSIHTSHPPPNECTDVTLIGYDEHRDLAQLKCKPRAGNISVLPVAAQFEPLPAPPGGGLVYGHPNGNVNKRSRAEFPSERVLDSDRYFVGLGESLFAEPPHPLIEIEALIERGMSGGPVVLDGKAIGVISGSQADGGRQRGWAIPARGYSGLKPGAGVKFDSLPPVTLLRDGRNPTSYLRVAMPEERLRLLVESAAQLRDLTAAMEELRADTAAQARIRALRSDLVSRARISRDELDAIGRTLWSVGYSTDFRRRVRSAEDLAAAEAGVLAKRLQVFGTDLLLMSRLVVPVGEEKIDLLNVASALKAPLLSGRPEAQATLAEIEQFIAMVDLEKSNVEELTKLYSALASHMNRLTAARRDVVAKQTGATAAAYLDAIIAVTDAFTAQVAQFITHTDLYVRMLERTLTVNANPVVLDMRLGYR
jgi:hypothetical protein